MLSADFLQTQLLRLVTLKDGKLTSWIRTVSRICFKILRVLPRPGLHPATKFHEIRFGRFCPILTDTPNQKNLTCLASLNDVLNLLSSLIFFHPSQRQHRNNAGSKPGKLIWRASLSRLSNIVNNRFSNGRCHEKTWLLARSTGIS